VSEANTGDCPSDGELARMVEGALGGATLASIQAHVEGCEHCAAVVAVLDTRRRRAAGGGSGARIRISDPDRRHSDADAFNRTLPSRELESAARVSATELPPAFGSGPYSDPGLGADTGPRSDPGLHADAGSRARTRPHPDEVRAVAPIPRSGTGGRPKAETRGLRAAPPPSASARRIAPIAIAGVAAAAGVVAVLLGARALSRKPRPADSAGSAAVEAPAPAPGSAGPRVESIGPGSAAIPEPAPSPTAAAGSADPAGRPAGVPLDPPAPPRAPGSKPVAVAPPAAAGSFPNLSTFFEDVQKHVRQHDGRACKRLYATLPAGIHPSMKYAIESFGAYCDMLAGDCAGGTARLVQAQAAQGMNPQPANYVEQYCPIEGPLETRLQRLRTQLAAHTMGMAMDVAWCDALLPHAKRAAGEVSTGPERGLASFALHQLAKCLGFTGRCDEARALWSLSNTVDESSKHQQPDLGPRCAAASAELAAAESYADGAPLIQTLTTAIRAHDVPGCRKLIASPIPNVPAGQKYSIELLLGQCEMLSGNCTAGTARLDRIGPSSSGRQISPEIRKAWLQSNVSTYCPIAGDLDARLARLWAQVDAFTTRDHGNLAWCDAIIPAARTAAGEASTDAQRKRAGRVLQRLAACVALAGRCDQGRDLWALSTQADPAAPATPALGAKCP